MLLGVGLSWVVGIKWRENEKWSGPTGGAQLKCSSILGVIHMGGCKGLQSSNWSVCCDMVDNVWGLPFVRVKFEHMIYHVEYLGPAQVSL